MEVFTHNYSDSNICIYSLIDDVLRGSFFKEKPVVGDLIIYQSKSLVIDEIILNRDAVISPECTKDKTLAYFEFKVTNDLRQKTN